MSKLEDDRRVIINHVRRQKLERGPGLRDIYPLRRFG